MSCLSLLFSALRRVLVQVDIQKILFRRGKNFLGSLNWFSSLNSHYLCGTEISSRDYLKVGSGW